ncbi:MAG: alpha-glucuronidase family glycosyl hydrolase [Phycisphaerae bacterium]
MKFELLRGVLTLIILVFLIIGVFVLFDTPFKPETSNASGVTTKDDGYRLWLKYDTIQNEKLLKSYRSLISSVIVPGQSEMSTIIREEISKGLAGLLGKEISVNKSSDRFGSLYICKAGESDVINKARLSGKLNGLGSEGYIIQTAKLNNSKTILVCANDDNGLLYGMFAFLRLIQTGQSLENLNIISSPKIQYRLLNHWDNLNGTIERGYAGKSLWKWNELPDKIDERYKDYARANASIGINGTVLNNVNANPNILRPEYLKKTAALADVFRPYGIKVFLSVNFSSPISSEFEIDRNRRGGIGDLPTSDPMNPKVRQWWKDKAKEIYELIPDFGGFLVKANSEGMPGPQDYQRTHVDGANMLAEALEPYKGIVMWRAFVYDADVDPDRAKRAYMEFVPLDSQFHKNVFVQPKNGPIDFQPREPVLPLFGAMPKTPLMLELQITQEYLGHSTHLVYLAPMWKEYFDFDTYADGRGSSLGKIIDGSLHGYHITGVAGVANTGNDRNWCGHLFAQANWYAYGRLSWDYELTSEQIAKEWIKSTLTGEPAAVATIESMMMGSWEACVNYMTPLGLHHIMQEDFHYGPEPQLASAARDDWNSVYYHRADANGIGFNRSSTGSNAVSQYFSPLREIFDDVNSCPEKYLLWFHHVPWDFKMKSGRTLWDELCYRYYLGTDYVDKMAGDWQRVEKYINPYLFSHVAEKLQQHKKDAGIWRDTCLKYFQKFSEKPISEPN